MMIVNMPTRNSVMNFLFKSVLQEVSEQQLISLCIDVQFWETKGK